MFTISQTYQHWDKPYVAITCFHSYDFDLDQRYSEDVYAHQKLSFCRLLRTHLTRVTHSVVPDFIGD